MRRFTWILAPFATFLVLGAEAIAQDVHVAGAERAVVNEALRLIPAGKTLSVAVVDPDLTGDPAAVRRLDAFVVRESNGEIRQTVYLNRESRIMRAAVKGSDFYVKVLAAVIHHEAAHLAGLDEPAAARAEREFFHELISKGLVPEAEGLAYLRCMQGSGAGPETRAGS